MLLILKSHTYTKTQSHELNVTTYVTKVFWSIINDSLSSLNNTVQRLVNVRVSYVISVTCFKTNKLDFAAKTIGADGIIPTAE